MITINIHSIAAVRAKLTTHKTGTTWVDIQFYNTRGIYEEVCVFFEDRLFACNFTDAINKLNNDDPGVGETLKAAGIVEEVPSPIEGATVFTFKRD